MQDVNSLARFIDHTLLKPEATQDQISNLCKEAIQFQFAGVCVNSVWIDFVVKSVAGTNILPVAVVGFPLGAMETKAKAFEAELAAKFGAKEIDMVIPVGLLKSQQTQRVREDIASVVKASGKALVKVIIETGLLTNEEKKVACSLAKEAGAHFVKTCTGFSAGAATVEDVKLMKSVVGSALQVKASGGIKTADFAKALIEAGASRLGTSSGVALVTQGHQNTGGY